MAVKTKDQLQKELNMALLNIKELEEKEANYKKKVAKAVTDCIEEYGLDLCPEGLNDFASRIGIELESTTDGWIAIQISNIQLKGKPTNWGYDILDSEYDKFEALIKHALQDIIDEYGGTVSIEEMGE